MRVCYLIGQPGSGKTTLMRELISPWEAIQHAKPFAHLSYDHPLETVAQLGRDRGTFSGTDALSMGVQPNVISWLHTRPYDLILGEGDRLANESFFTEARKVGKLFLVHVLTDPSEARARRAERGHQNESWVRGRVTKVQNLLENNAHVVVIGDGDVKAEAEKLRRMLWG